MDMLISGDFVDLFSDRTFPYITRYTMWETVSSTTYFYSLFLETIEAHSLSLVNLTNIYIVNIKLFHLFNIFYTFLLLILIG